MKSKSKLKFFEENTIVDFDENYLNLLYFNEENIIRSISIVKKHIQI